MARAILSPRSFLTRENSGKDASVVKASRRTTSISLLIRGSLKITNLKERDKLNIRTGLFSLENSKGSINAKER